MLKFAKKALKHPLETAGLLLVFSFLVITLLDSIGVFTLKTSVSEEISNRRRDVQEVVSAEEQPLRVVIEKVGVDIQIQNPESTDINVLDNELRYGAVHYPGSGTPGNGNMFLFGHSADAFFVRNPAFKAFDGIKDLERGDEVIIYSRSQKHLYKVLNVELVSAEEALVDFSVQKDMLTLSTCNTFGKRQDRFVVEADYVGSEAI